MNISYSDGRTIPCTVEIWADLHTERSGYFRAFWVECDSTGAPCASTGTPVIGYCSSGGSHRTITATAAEARRLHPGQQVWRRGRIVAGV